MADTVLVHPNRDKAASQATRGIVFLLLLISAALILIVTLGGWSHLQGAQPISFAYVIVYVVMAWQVARWNRGVLPVAAALAILFAVIAAVAGPAVVRPRQGGLRRPGARPRDPRHPDRRAGARSSCCLAGFSMSRVPAAVARGGRGDARRGRPLLQRRHLGRPAHADPALESPASGGGGIGRLDGFKIHCPRGRVGSSPTRRIRPALRSVAGRLGRSERQRAVDLEQRPQLA